LEKARRYFAFAGAVIGGIVAVYLRSPLEGLVQREFGIYELAGLILFVAAIAAVVFFFLGPRSRR
jgi:hypothetical protein